MRFGLKTQGAVHVCLACSWLFLLVVLSARWNKYSRIQVPCCRGVYQSVSAYEYLMCLAMSHKFIHNPEGTELVGDVAARRRVHWPKRSESEGPAPRDIGFGSFELERRRRLGPRIRLRIKQS